jgi:hypothetical protein
MFALVLAEQFKRDPDQHQPPNTLQERDFEQERGQNGKEHAQDDRATRAQENRPAALGRRQPVRGHADEDGVITAEHEINDDDTEHSAG